MAARTPARAPGRLDFKRKPFYTPAEVAQILQVSDQTVLERIHEGSLFAVRVGPRLLRIPLGAVLQFLGERPEIHWTRDPTMRVDSKHDRAQDAAEH